MNAPDSESHLRSWLKAISWRIVATTTTAVISYVVTGSVETAIQIGALEFLFKLFVYYGHERIWLLLPRGTIRRVFRR